MIRKGKPYEEFMENLSGMMTHFGVSCMMRRLFHYPDMLDAEDYLFVCVDESTALELTKRRQNGRDTWSLVQRQGGKTRLLWTQSKKGRQLEEPELYI